MLLVWKGQPELKALEEFVESAKKSSGKDAAVENMDMFQAREENFEVVFVGAVTPQMKLSLDEWSRVLKSLKPSGTVVLATTDIEAAAKQLKLSGFINVSEPKPITDGVEVIGQRPAFEVGATAQLKLKKKVWTVDDDDDIVNEDDLLDESDKQKPSKEDLKCATTGEHSPLESQINIDASLRCFPSQFMTQRNLYMNSNLREEKGV